MNRANRVGVIVNPKSGVSGARGESGPSRLDLARRVFAGLGLSGDVVATAARGDAVRLAQAMATSGVDVVVAWGGDGTINEVAGPLIGTPVALGIVRSGSGDGLGRTLGIPEQPEAAMALAAKGTPRAIDVGYLGDRHFLNVAGIGFDAAVAKAFNAGGRRGQAGYLLRTLQTVRGYRSSRYRIRLEHEASDSTRFLVAFANGREYGGHLILAADADPSDGLLDAVLVNDGSMLRQLWRMRRLSFGVHRPAEGIFRYRVKHATVAGDRLVCHVDGETFETSGEVAVRVAPGALKIVV
jgi:YegS/Rv2252/BmrU family lipid kinase